MNHVSEILLSLFILNLGTAFGAGLYETKIVLPRWFHKTTDGYRVNAAAMRDLDSGRSFWAFVTTGPLTLLTLANLVFAWQSQQPDHSGWMAAALVALLERVGTFAFFIPTAIKLGKADQLAPAQASRKVTLWLNANYIRNALTLIASLLALRALAIGV
ncbi:DUF1772 domain-containing protein [Salmonirosea aquatica]|uniref:DUF1772 domain-containing protein n=1 Tax=Salmonirosea aquatica TaxID=2654236 RepID=A0A7C9BUE3_9BACT|nr:DUF1772 domain-containing protein [Cytophagaceae bacterium SJW1-29]